MIIVHKKIGATYAILLNLVVQDNEGWVVTKQIVTLISTVQKPTNLILEHEEDVQDAILVPGPGKIV